MFDADIAEIVRSQKKDEEYVDEFSSSVRALAQNFLGQRRYVRFEKELRLVGPLLYYAVTTLSGKKFVISWGTVSHGILSFSGLQTLGEEYVGLIETVRGRGNRRVVPSLVRRVVFVLLQVCGPQIVDILLLSARKRLVDSELDKKQSWINVLDAARRDAIPALQRLHLALFYIFGRYYHLSKRVAGVRLVSLRPSTNWNFLFLFRWLGYSSVVQILVSLVLWSYSELIALRLDRRSKADAISKSDELIEERRASSFRCQLCLDEGKPFACTPCGHPFCWDCLLEHVVENRNCPLCRSDVTPSRVIPLFNV